MELTDFERFVAKICQWKTALIDGVYLLYFISVRTTVVAENVTYLLNSKLRNYCH